MMVLFQKFADEEKARKRRAELGLVVRQAESRCALVVFNAFRPVVEQERDNRRN